MWRLEGEVGSSTWKSTQHDASIVVRVGDDGIHELVVRGGDAVEVDGHVVIWLERALRIGVELSCDRKKASCRILRAKFFGRLLYEFYCKD